MHEPRYLMILLAFAVGLFFGVVFATIYLTADCRYCGQTNAQCITRRHVFPF